jgi:hypothetical protein
MLAVMIGKTGNGMTMVGSYIAMDEDTRAGMTLALVRLTDAFLKSKDGKKYGL